MHGAELQLSGDASSVPVARRFVSGTLSAWGHDEAAWAAAQIVSELATNCALHARTPYVVRLSDNAGRLRLEVSDRSPVRLQPRRYSNESTTGRGLRLVAELADSWGVDGHPDGKTVWVMLRRSYGEIDEGGPRAGRDDAVAFDRLLATFDDGEDTAVGRAALRCPPLAA